MTPENKNFDRQQRSRIPRELPQAMLGLTPPTQNPFDAALTLHLMRNPSLVSGPGTIDHIQTVRAAVLRPGALSEPESWLPLLPKEEKLLRGAVLCRAGKHAEALGELKGLDEPLALLVGVLAEVGKGDREAARKAFERAKPHLPDDKTPLPWAQRVEIETLRREAEAAVNTLK